MAGTTERGKKAVANDTRFKPGMSGNADAKWKLGQSGNPAGKSKRRLQFDEALQRALMVEVSPQEVARLVAEAARAGESWATRELVRRTAIVPRFCLGRCACFGFGRGVCFVPGKVCPPLCKRHICNNLFILGSLDF